MRRRGRLVGRVVAGLASGIWHLRRKEKKMTIRGVMLIHFRVVLTNKTR